MEHIFFVMPSGQFAVAQKEYWEEHHGISDKSDAELAAKMKGLGFYEVRTNVFERPAFETVSSAKELLIRGGFEERQHQI